MARLEPGLRAGVVASDGLGLALAACGRCEHEEEPKGGCELCTCPAPGPPSPWDDTSTYCFTSVICGPPLGIDAGSGDTCGRNPGPSPGDDSCHRRCATSADCPQNEDCKLVPYFGRQDFNGYPKGKGICCAPNETCD